MKTLIEKILLLDENKKIIEKIHSKYYIKFYDEIGFENKIIENIFWENEKIINNFCLEFNAKLKHISYTNIIINNKIKYFIVLISCFDNYEKKKKILNIFSSFFINNNKNIDKKLLSFYAYFFLNIFIIEKKQINYKIKYLFNNNNKNNTNEYLLTFYKHKIINQNLIFPLPEIELTILFDYFHIDDIIKIYSYLLKEYYLIFIYYYYIYIYYILYFFFFLFFCLFIYFFNIVYVGFGIGVWGVGIGPNPQSPIPNPQSPIPIR